MSATRDKNQKFTFVYKSFHEILKQAKSADVPTKPESDAGARSALIQDENPAAEPRPFSVRRDLNAGQVIRAAEARKAAQGVKAPKVETVEMPEPVVKEYRPVALLGKRVAKPSSLDMARKIAPGQLPVANPAIQDLKANLQNLKDLHARLRFMLQELEELTKE